MSLVAQRPTDYNSVGVSASLSQSGLDLSNFADNLASVRLARTLDFRRSCLHKDKKCESRDNSIQGLLNKSAATPLIDKTVALQTIAEACPHAIDSLCERLSSAAQSNQKIIRVLFSCQIFRDAYFSAICLDIPRETVALMIQTLADSAHLFDETIFEEIFNSDLPFSMLDFLESDSNDLIQSCVNFVRESAAQSGYGRDALTNYGYQTILIGIAQNSQVEDITMSACSAIQAIFQNPEPMDSTTVIECVKPIVQMLEQLPECTHLSLLQTLASMSYKAPSMIFSLYEIGFYPVAVNMLDIPEYVDIALNLVGNMSNAQALYVKTLIDSGLLEKLDTLLNEGHLNDTFWVMSNLLESAPNLLLPMFTLEFVVKTSLMVADSTSSVKDEAAFFISTVIHCSGSTSSLQFMVPEVIDLLVEVLGCEINDTVMRCLDALHSLIAAALNEGDISYFKNSDIEERLTELSEGEPGKITTYAKYLLNMLEAN